MDVERTAGDCHRFFAYSKRVPKDVKRYCGICRQHGLKLETRGHACAFKDCCCNKCELVRTRRQVMSQQIRLRRAQDKRFQRTTELAEADVIPIKDAPVGSGEDLDAQKLIADAKNMCYFCQKCKNHGILVWKKNHKRQCPYVECPCPNCDLIETRRRLDQHIKQRKQSTQDGSVLSSLKEEAQSPSTMGRDEQRSVSSGYSSGFDVDSLRCSPMDATQCILSSAAASTPFPAKDQSGHLPFHVPAVSAVNPNHIINVMIPHALPSLMSQPTSASLPYIVPSQTMPIWVPVPSLSSAFHVPTTTTVPLPTTGETLLPTASPFLDPLLQQLLRTPCLDLTSQLLGSYKELEALLAVQSQRLLL